MPALKARELFGEGSAMTYVVGPNTMVEPVGEPAAPVVASNGNGTPCTCCGCDTERQNRLADQALQYADKLFDRVRAAVGVEPWDTAEVAVEKVEQAFAAKAALESAVREHRAPMRVDLIVPPVSESEVTAALRAANDDLRLHVTRLETANRLLRTDIGGAAGHRQELLDEMTNLRGQLESERKAIERAEAMRKMLAATLELKSSELASKATELIDARARIAELTARLEQPATPPASRRVLNVDVAPPDTARRRPAVVRIQTEDEL